MGAMIREPLILPIGKDHAKVIKKYKMENPENDILFYDQHLSGIRYIGIAPSYGEGLDLVCLAILQGAVPEYRIQYGGRMIKNTKENFFDTLRDKFPDCFEWFLFNPELI